MKLYIGGRGQGQETLARNENPDCEIILDFQDMVRAWLKDGADPVEKTLSLCENHPGAVIVSDEIGCGVVPMDREDRHWREQTGRAQCLIAEHADCVIRVFCGIEVRIK